LRITLTQPRNHNRNAMITEYQLWWDERTSFSLSDASLRRIFMLRMWVLTCGMVRQCAICKDVALISSTAQENACALCGDESRDEHLHKRQGAEQLHPLRKVRMRRAARGQEGIQKTGQFRKFTWFDAELELKATRTKPSTMLAATTDVTAFF
jgi:hypothetical protein